MPKETYRNEAKIKSIEKQKDFIGRTLIGKHGKDPKDLRVAFFPGREALEYEVAYAPLGIPTENIYAIERDPEIHAFWKKDGRFNITDEPLDDSLFFPSYEGQPFDVISLDYDGQFSSRVSSDVLRNIVTNQIFEEESVLCTNFLGKREKEKVKQAYELPFFNERIYRELGEGLIEMEERSEDLREKIMKGKDKDDLLNILVEFREAEKYHAKERPPLESKEERKLKEKRDMGITLNILDPLLKGLSYKEINLFFQNEIFARRIEKHARAEMGKDGMNYEDEEDIKARSLRIGSEWGYIIYVLDPELKSFLSERGYPEEALPLIEAVPDKAYYPEEIERYSYVSDNGALMLQDLFMLNQRKDILAKYGDIYQGILSGNLGLPPIFRNEKKRTFIDKKAYQKDRKKLIKKIDQYYSEVTEDVRKLPRSTKKVKIPEREDLGSSYKPIVKTKSKLKELVAQGLSREEIEDQFRISSEVAGSLPAFIAHRTMGRYEQEEPIEVEQSPKPSNPLEKIVEEQAELKLIPHGKRKQLIKLGRFTEGIAKRLEFFEDDISHLSEAKIQALYDSILDSKWYEPILKREVSDIKVYSFFDDLMLYVKKKRKIPASEEIKDIWHNGIKLRNYTKKKEKTKKSPKEHNQEIYDSILNGVSDEEIMYNFDLTKRQLGARKAWVTMRQKEVTSIN